MCEVCVGVWCGMQGVSCVRAWEVCIRERCACVCSVVWYTEWVLCAWVRVCVCEVFGVRACVVYRGGGGHVWVRAWCGFGVCPGAHSLIQRPCVCCECAGLQLGASMSVACV